MRRVIPFLLALAWSAVALAAEPDTLDLAKRLTTAGQYREAQSVYDRLAAAAPSPRELAPVLLARADAYLSAGDFGAASTALQAAQRAGIAPEQQQRAKTLDDKINAKLAFQQLTGSVTLSAAHDSRVRHRISVPSNGTGTEEVCTINYIGSGDDDGASSVEAEEDCEEIEVPAGAQSRRVLANIQDNQVQVQAKFDHRLNFDSHGSAWRTVAELSESWQFIASDQDLASLKVRTGPSWFIPDWQMRLEIGGAYQNNRANHMSTLDIYSPVGSIEIRPIPSLRISSTYSYEIRHATPVVLIGNAHTGDLQARWDVTKLDRLSAKLLLRSQSARDGFSGFDSAEIRLTYRRGFELLGATGWYGEIEPRLRAVKYAMPSNNANDNGMTRRDLTHSVVTTLGRDLSPAWTLLGSYAYSYAESNFLRFNRDNNRFLGSVVRNF